MSLTLGGGPLAGHVAGPTNYEIDGPPHRLLFQPHPRRIRAMVGDRTVLDTVRGSLLHETRLLPVLYVPFDDLDAGALEPTDHHTHCPFKGEASYWSLRVGDHLAENAVWSYPEPLEVAPWLAGQAAMYWQAADAWYEEDEEVHGHLRDPYHRVDARPASRVVEVNAGGAPVVRAERAVLVYETGLPVRAYVTGEDVAEGELVPSETVTYCPYKGRASFWSLRLGARLLEDAAWSYEEPLEDATRIAGLLSFDHEALEVAIGEPRGETVGQPSG